MAGRSHRFSTFALLAIVLPAAIVAALGYVSLQQWRRSSELLFREQARTLGAMAAEKVSLVVRASEDESVTRLESGLDCGEPDPRAIHALLENTPLIRRLAIFDRRGERRRARRTAAAWPSNGRSRSICRTANPIRPRSSSTAHPPT